MTAGRMHKFVDLDFGRTYAFATTGSISGVGAAAAPTPYDVARSAAPVILAYLQGNYPQVLAPEVRPSNSDARLVYVQGVYRAQAFDFYVMPSVLAAGYSPTLTFVDDEVDRCLEHINAVYFGHAGVAFAPVDAPATPAPRSPICPCGIDRRDCEYHQ